MSLTPRQRLLRNTALGAAGLLVAITGLVALQSGADAEADASAGVVDVLARDIPTDAPRLSFVDRSDLLHPPFRHFVGTRTHRLPEDMGSGLAWGDCDGDGDLDLYAVSFGGPLGSDPAERAADALYENRGADGFVDVATEAGVDSTAHGMGAVWADYDGDDDLDLYVTNYGPNRLYRNEGQCRFTDVTATTGVDGGDVFSAGATWGDYDGDGDLDLYVTNYVEFDPDDDPGVATQQYGRSIPFTLNPSSYGPSPNRLFRNEGDGTFVEVARGAGVDNPRGRSMSAVWADFDQDADLDLYVANDISDNAFYRNHGDGTFEDVSSFTMTADYRGAMGLAVADVDRDRDLDFFVTHWLAQENALYLNHMSEVGAEEMFFGDEAEMYGLGYTGLKFVGWGTSLLDLDNDGRRDLFVANGSTLEMEDDRNLLEPQRIQLFWNRGEEGYFEITEIAGPALAGSWVARGAAAADWDEDGDVDVAMLVNGGELVLLENSGPPRGSWLTVRLRQPGANRAGIGALVTVERDGTPQMLAVGAAPSYLSQEPYALHFGLGEAPGPVSVTVRWPDGSSESWEGVPVDGTVVLNRGEGSTDP